MGQVQNDMIRVKQSTQGIIGPRVRGSEWYVYDYDRCVHLTAPLLMALR